MLHSYLQTNFRETSAALRRQRIRVVTVVSIAGTLLTTSIHSSSGQGTPNGLPSIIPPSPTAAALEKYGQVPVSPYTGVPNISLPLYEVKVRDLSIPISLTYHAGGFRVSEEASWVGLGWSLQAGGAITRTVRGLEDLQYFIRDSTMGFPFIMPDPIPGKDLTENSPAYQDLLHYSGNGFNVGDPFTGTMATIHMGQYIAAKGIVYPSFGNTCGPAAEKRNDWEPDDFRFSMGAQAGQFAFKQDGSIHLIEQQKVKIEPPTLYQPPVWKITTADGFQYFFTAPENTYAITPVQEQQLITTAWYLTRIVSPLGEEATLTYQKGPLAYTQAGLSQNDVVAYEGSCDYISTLSSGSFSTGSSTPQYLQRIDFRTGHLLFERDTTAGRLDLRGGQKLKRVLLYDAANKLQKAYELQTSYFEPEAVNQGTNLPTNDPGIPFEGKRLRLDAVVELGADGTPKPATRFTYNATSLPPKSSYSVDFWGYYNAQPNNTLLPEYSGPGLSAPYVFKAGANRRPQAEAMQACILQKITYPTGGATTFTFEPNTYSNITTEDYIVQQQSFTQRFAQDNGDPSLNIPATSFSFTVPTPVEVNYTLTAEDQYAKRQTQLQLIDEATNSPVLLPTSANRTYSCTWGFVDADNPSASSILRAQDHILVPPGNYHFAAQFKSLPCSSTDCHGYVQVYATYAVLAAASTTGQPQLAGGLRIKRIESFDGLHSSHNQVRTYTYNYGVLMNRPIFSKVTAAGYATPTSGNGSICVNIQRLTYNQNYFSAGAKGNTVGYSDVFEEWGNQQEGGKTEYVYHCLPDREVDYSDRLPNIPIHSDALNGYLQTQNTYRKTGTGFQLLSKVEHEYESVNSHQLPGMHKGSYWAASTSSYTLYKQNLYYYELTSRWVRPTYTTNWQYDPQDESRFLATTTRYTYDTLKVGHMQVSQVRTRRSDGSTQLTSTTYPADYSSVTAGPLAAMRSDAVFQHAAAIETRTQVYGPTETAADARTIAGSYTEYTRPSNSSKFLPASVSALELTQPTAQLPVAAPSLPAAGRYVRKHKILYEPATANVQQEQKEHDIPTVFLWGYANTLPVAQVQRATLAQVQAALGGVDVNTLTTEQQLRDTFQQLRQRLPQAQITSFTHDPLVGMTSRTDPTGRTFYYEYDGLHRLIRTRDEQGRILSQQQYHYAGQ